MSMPSNEIVEHRLALTKALAAGSRTQFVAAFKRYAQACARYEVDPFATIGALVYDMVEGYDAAMTAMARQRRGSPS